MRSLLRSQNDKYVLFGGTLFLIFLGFMAIIKVIFEQKFPENSSHNTTTTLALNALQELCQTQQFLYANLPATLKFLIDAYHESNATFMTSRLCLGESHSSVCINQKRQWRQHKCETFFEYKNQRKVAQEIENHFNELTMKKSQKFLKKLKSKKIFISFIERIMHQNSYLISGLVGNMIGIGNCAEASGFSLLNILQNISTQNIASLQFVSISSPHQNTLWCEHGQTLENTNHVFLLINGGIPDGVYDKNQYPLKLNFF